MDDETMERIREAAEQLIDHEPLRTQASSCDTEIVSAFGDVLATCWQHEEVADYLTTAPPSRVLALLDEVDRLHTRVEELKEERTRIWRRQRDLRLDAKSEARKARGLFHDACRENAKLRQRVEELDDERRWIPVEERLPEDDRAVAILWSFRRSAETWPAVAHYDGEWSGLSRSTLVTHWTPLPDPPDAE
jgi:hypothetical protein